ncbi:MAG: MASE1 domain-containing protein [Candidatus Eremiobacteraeota bacterium]|nr:MASE1 domain-containing protein [Candidatus Eremiobacteraeota bacterium]
MDKPVFPRLSVSDILVMGGVAVAYVVFARIGLSLAFETRQVTAVWPPTGIALAALLIWGYRIWPGIWIGAFLTNAFAAEPLWTAAAIAAGNTAGPLAGAIVLRKVVGFDNRMERLRDVLGLVTFGSLLAMAINATNGVFELAVAHIVPWSAYGPVWLRWWAGDAMGALIVAPLVLTFFADRGPSRREGGITEAILLFGGVGVLAWLSFSGTGLRPFPIYPFVIWAALRFRQRETAIVIGIIATLAVWCSVRGFGPFGTGQLDQRLTLLLAYMAALAVTGQVLAAVRAEWRGTSERLEAALERSMRIAQKLQTAFLPKQLPRRDDLRLDAVYITARREALIGGDWYDAFELGDGRIAISIGDVTGHGLDAAVAAGRIRQGINAASLDTADPSAILRKVNRTLKFQDDAMATALVAVVDRERETISYASAGHPPPIVAGPTIPVQSLKYGGLPLGVADAAEYQTHGFRLERDAVVLFYTDGLTEFDRDIDRVEAMLRNGVSRLVGDTSIAHPALVLQRDIMGAESPLDDTALLVLQLSPFVEPDPLAGGNELRQTWYFQSDDVYSAHAARHTIMSFLRHFAAADADLFRSELILGEILSNTTEHAPGPVTVEVDWTSARPIVTVFDSGPGMALSAPALPTDVLTESGRGLFLIATLSAKVHVEASPGGGTTMRVTLPVARDGF